MQVRVPLFRLQWPCTQLHEVGVVLDDFINNGRRKRVYSVPVLVQGFAGAAAQF